MATTYSDESITSVLNKLEEERMNVVEDGTQEIYSIQIYPTSCANLKTVKNRTPLGIHKIHYKASYYNSVVAVALRAPV
jgi:hypothetical protein